MKIYTSGVVDFRIAALDLIEYVQSVGKVGKEEQDFCNELRIKLANKEYYINDPEVNDDYKRNYLSQPIMYVIHKFDLEDLFNWIRIYFDFKGYPCDSFEEAGFENFAFDVNPVLRIFSMDNVKKFEMQLGTEWWKSKKERD
jgi:hypothetical protein